MYNTIQNIKKSVKILTRSGDYYDVQFTVYENDFVLEDWSDEQLCDQLKLNNEYISIENLNDMHFIVDSELKTLQAIIESIEPEIQTKADEWDAQTEQDEIDEERYRQEVSSPYLSGRI